MWYVYILECKDGSLYTGVTNDLERRFKEHQKGTAHYTSYNSPKSVVYTELFPTKSEALKRESQIKSWTRRKKLALIAGDYQRLKQHEFSGADRRDVGLAGDR